MSVWVYSFCYNEAAMMPFYLRHYEQIADRIVIFDEQSNDGTREMLEAHPLVEIREWNLGMNDAAFVGAIYDTYKEARGKAHWVMWPDIDEFLYSPNLAAELDNPKHRVLGATGYALIRKPGTPDIVDDGKSQIHELCKTGYPQPNEDKWIVWRPEIEIRHMVGRHQIYACSEHLSRRPLMLLHAHFINGFEATQARNRRNIERSEAAGNKHAAWSYREGATGPSSNEWLRHAEANLERIV